MSFFDAQPAGRLLNRFSRDTEALDVVLGETVQSVLTCFSSTVFSVLVALAATPAVAGLLAPLAFVFWRVQTAYIAASREIKRLDSVALSPVFGAFSETLAGLTTLRAFRAAGPACARQARLLDASTRAMWPMRVLDRWLSVRLELLANGVVGAVALVFAVAPPSTAGVAGLALTSALQLTGLLNWAVRKATELEVNITSVERVVDTETEPTEAPAVVPGHRPPPGWPTAGAVAVEGLVVRYRADLDPVLRGVSFTVAPGAKVGIVGRTGSGKSTLCAALFRIVEPVAGRVVIDGVDTASLGLADLRRALGLVPQDPVLFSGTIRSNLDPLGAHPDPALWTALDRAALGGAVRAMPHGLDAKVGEAGAGLSAGERQLLAVARALLRTPRVLLLDEATSSVDGATDAAILAAIRTHFKDATVLTIAHRLHTVADSDVVVVMDGGVVAEWGPPAALLADAGGAFRGLVDEAARGRARGVGRAASAAELLAGVGGGG
jgi:ABC-type multidrug transport system fused ATPase/permease subunit